MVVTVLSIHMLLFYFKTTYSFIDVLRKDFKYIIEIEIVISIHNDCCALHGGQEIPFLIIFNVSESGQSVQWCGGGTITCNNISSSHKNSSNKINTNQTNLFLV